ncbi:MAG: sensor histidine kinase, partial [Chloroflexota bacterium]
IYTANPIEKNMFDYSSERKVETIARQKSLKSLNSHSDFRKVAETILLKEYTPANVIINSQMEIVYIHGDISPFLEPSQGKATFNLLKMAREGLSFELRSTLHKVRTSNVAVTKNDIPMMNKGNLIHASIEIIPLENCIDPYFLIIFKQSKSNAALTQPGGEESRIIDEYLARISQLEQELAHAREDMRSITEDQETVSEELQSANEEMLSSNEELQSLNEELESSKEELINSNEELRILINQLQLKNKQIDAINKYTDTIMSTIRKPLIVIDSGYNIKTTNRAFNDKFEINLDVSMQGFFEINNQLFNIPKLRVALEKFVVQRAIELEDLEFEMKGINNRNLVFQLNASKFTSPTEERLILLSFIDITVQKLNEKRIRDFSEELETTVAERNHSISLINKQLEQYAHTTNHEFQEPLRKLVTFSKSVRKFYEGNSPERVSEFIGKIELAATRMAVLINDMHNYASVSHHQKLFQKTDLNQIIKDTLFDFELLIEEKKAKIVVKNRLPEIIAIPFQMNQLFYDLLSNSLKFIRDGVPPVISISSHKLPSAALKKFPKLNPKNTYHQINIEDNGIGFNQKYASQIFTMFQRLNSAFEYPGTGIGLALCKKIVDDYHGHIFAEGVEDSRAIFHVILPEIQPEKI